MKNNFGFKGFLETESVFSKIGWTIAILAISVFLFAKTGVTLQIIDYTEHVGLIEYLSFIIFCIPIVFYARSFIKKRKESIILAKYVKKLNSVLIAQSHNELFYSGNIYTGSAILVKEVAETLNADRASIWLYDNERSSVVCQQLYESNDGSFYQEMELLEKDYSEYFRALDRDPVIVANCARTHPATKCFLDSYLIPLGIRSMLDVPIWYKGSTIGVICIENREKREWLKEEIDFAHLLSSLYSFAFSIRENNEKQKEIEEFEKFVNAAVLVSMADSRGKITYANEKFTQISGWSLDELLGKDHSIVNSDEQVPGYWTEMYKAVSSGEIWTDVVTNRSKDGDLYYVDTYIKANFDRSGKLKGYTSIRQNVTDIMNSTKEIEKKNTYLEHAAKIIRHDMHSGINTYIPRGIRSLERRLTDEQIKELKIEAPLKMIKEGLKHAQKVYSGVYEFTNLVKKDSELTREEIDLKKTLADYLSSTAYSAHVKISKLGKANINASLFCTAIDNLIRNGLRYNDSDSKLVKIYREGDHLYVEDNGRGMSSEDFKRLSKPYTRKEGQLEAGTGLGLNICVAILEEHGFSIKCDVLPKGGTQLKIKIV